MTILVLVILAVIWAAVLVPPYLQNRSEARPADSISTFRNQLDTLERRAYLASPGGRPVPRAAISMSVDRGRLARNEAKKRRRDILVTLLAASGLTLLLGLFLAPVLVLHVLVDILLVGYIGLLLRFKRAAEERAAKVHYLQPARRPMAVPAAPALRSTAAN